MGRSPGGGGRGSPNGGSVPCDSTAERHNATRRTVGISECDAVHDGGGAGRQGAVLRARGAADGGIMHSGGGTDRRGVAAYPPQEADVSSMHSGGAADSTSATVCPCGTARRGTTGSTASANGRCEMSREEALYSIVELVQEMRDL